MRNELGQFVKGIKPHNKMPETVCVIEGCGRTDMKAYGLCNRHYKRKQSRERKGIFASDLSKRLPRTQEHTENNFRNRSGTNSLKGKTYKDIYGEELAEIIKKKHSVSLVGVGLGRPSKQKGIPLKEETKRKLRDAMLGRFSGEKNFFWNGGKSKEEYGLEFTNILRERIRNRDSRKCAECGCPEIELDYRLCIHHIDEDKKNNSEKNLISLCRKCHAKAHYSKRDWANYFNEIIEEIYK